MISVNYWNMIREKESSNLYHPQTDRKLKKFHLTLVNFFKIPYALKSHVNKALIMFLKKTFTAGQLKIFDLPHLCDIIKTL